MELIEQPKKDLSGVPPHPVLHIISPGPEMLPVRYKPTAAFEEP